MKDKELLYPAPRPRRVASLSQWADSQERRAKDQQSSRQVAAPAARPENRGGGGVPRAPSASPSSSPSPSLSAAPAPAPKQTFSSKAGPDQKETPSPQLLFRLRQQRQTNLQVKAVVFLQQTVNNLFVVVKDRSKRVLVVRSAGFLGFRGSKKNGYFAALSLARETARLLRLRARRPVRIVFLSKVTKNLKGMAKELARSGLRVLELVERIRVPHNGLRGPKARRL